MTVSHLNLADVEAFYHLALRHNAVPEFAFLRNQGRAGDGWPDMRLSVKERLSVISLVKRLNRETGTDAFFPLCETSCPLADPAGPVSINIRADGTILPCQMMSGTDITLGNALYLNPEQFIWLRGEISKLARLRESMDFDCRQCFLRSICKRGCMAEAVLRCEDPLGNDGQCELRRAQYLSRELILQKT